MNSPSQARDKEEFIAVSVLLRARVTIIQKIDSPLLQMKVQSKEDRCTKMIVLLVLQKGSPSF